jgi:hypothetical protein
MPPALQGTSQKTYGMDSPLSCEITGKCVCRRKTAAASILTPQPICFQEVKVMKKEKRMGRKILSCLLAVLVFASTMVLSGCKSEPLVIKDSDTYIVIKTTQEAMGNKTDMLLIEYMEKLKEKGELEFRVENGMITSINGIDNPADYSSCWMLYTSDAENANAAWGTVEYSGAVYGSAISGAETLKIKPEQLYIWGYKSFSE